MPYWSSSECVYVCEREKERESYLLIKFLICTWNLCMYQYLSKLTLFFLCVCVDVSRKLKQQFGANQSIHLNRVILLLLILLARLTFFLFNQLLERKKWGWRWCLFQKCRKAPCTVSWWGTHCRHLANSKKILCFATFQAYWGRGWEGG